MDEGVKNVVSEVRSSRGRDSADMSSEVRSFIEEAEEALGLTLPDVRSYSGLSLAFIGDGAYELAIRTLIISRGNTQVNKMHRQCSELVKAPAQAAMIRAVFDQLTEEEQAVCRRGHNTKPHTKAKNATADDYLWATGLEALCGWLYLKHDQRRLMEVIRTGLLAIGYEL
ncbi:MAG: ribonuclease III domain-containing protein [Lachnospiraceae bacterium]|nr:ribonuclease III domain-containing protein [Lachnospiraceae bacterium]MDY4970207.1 ribonuclease III domain-containing protein [Lachnospiraceae bacterium]